MVEDRSSQAGAAGVLHGFDRYGQAVPAQAEAIDAAAGDVVGVVIDAHSQEEGHENHERRQTTEKSCGHPRRGAAQAGCTPQVARRVFSAPALP